MAEKTSTQKKQISPDWLVQGVLTKIGDTFDRLLGRGWKPSSSLATSELVEKLKQLVDSEVRESDDKRKFVPHNIQLKMQWDKFSTDSEELLRTLEAELLTALVDHINDKRYYTYAPITLQVKPDYFTSGVKLFAGFEKSDEDERETAIDVSMPGFKDDPVGSGIDAPSAPRQATVMVRFDLEGRTIQKELTFEEGKRLTLGRTKENDVAVDDISVSKMHASLMLAPEQQFVVADTGSTNGTFIDGERISYGKAATFSTAQKLKLGTVELTFEIVTQPDLPGPEPAETETFRIGEFEFSGKVDEPLKIPPAALADTVASIAIPEPEGEEEEVLPNPTQTGIDLNLPDDEKAVSK